MARRGEAPAFELAHRSSAPSCGSAARLGDIKRGAGRYMDVHVPMVITQALRRRSLDILTSQEDGTATAGIVFAAQRGASLGGLARDLELILTCCEPEELRDRVTHLPLQ